MGGKNPTLSSHCPPSMVPLWLVPPMLFVIGLLAMEIWGTGNILIAQWLLCEHCLQLSAQILSSVFFTNMSAIKIHMEVFLSMMGWTVPLLQKEKCKPPSRTCPATAKSDRLLTLTAISCVCKTGSIAKAPAYRLEQAQSPAGRLS